MFNLSLSIFPAVFDSVNYSSSFYESWLCSSFWRFVMLESEALLTPPLLSSRCIDCILQFHSFLLQNIIFLQVIFVECYLLQQLVIVLAIRLRILIVWMIYIMLVSHCFICGPVSFYVFRVVLLSFIFGRIFTALGLFPLVIL